MIIIAIAVLTVVGLSTFREFRHDREAARFAKEAEAFLREGTTLGAFLTRFPDFFILSSAAPNCPKISKLRAPNMVEVRPAGLAPEILSVPEALAVLSRSLEQNESCRPLTLFYRFGTFVRTTVSFAAKTDLRMAAPFEVQYYR